MDIGPDYDRLVEAHMEGMRAADEAYVLTLESKLADVHALVCLEPASVACPSASKCGERACLVAMLRSVLR